MSDDKKVFRREVAVVLAARALLRRVESWLRTQAFEVPPADVAAAVLSAVFPPVDRAADEPGLIEATKSSLSRKFARLAAAMARDDLEAVLSPEIRWEVRETAELSKPQRARLAEFPGLFVAYVPAPDGGDAYAVVGDDLDELLLDAAEHRRDTWPGLREPRELQRAIVNAREALTRKKMAKPCRRCGMTFPRCYCAGPLGEVLG